MVLRNTRQFVDVLKNENDLCIIDDEVDPYLQLAEIQRRVVENKGPALLFTNVKGTKFPVATNLFGSEKRIDLAFGKRPVEFIQQAVELAEKAFPPKLSTLWNAKNLVWEGLKVGAKNVHNAPLLQSEIPNHDLTKLPQLHCWPEDGGAFVTLPLVYTEHPDTHKSNLGMYRVQLFDQNQCGMHIQIHRGGGFHYHVAEQRNQSLPAHVYIGGPPALIIAAVSPLPEDVPEILLASLLMGERLKKTSRPELSPLPFLSDADFCISGEIPAHARRPEGPFGDHYGYYSLKHDYPFMNVKHVFHRKDAIYPATVVGRPPQEDHFIACYLQDLLKPLIGLVMPQVKEVWAYEESGVHSLAGAVVQDRYPREALTTALRILGEGQLSLSKVLMVTDRDCDVKDFKTFLPIVLERMDFDSDLHVLSQISQDTLDYTGPKVNEGSKAIFLGVGEPKRELPKEFSGTFNDNRFSNPKMFCPGVLAVEATNFDNSDKLAQTLANEPCLKNWPLVCLVDDSTASTASAEDFLWHIFTRFEPAADIYASKTSLNRFHVSMTPPIVIDCRIKPWYPGELVPQESSKKEAEMILSKYKLLSSE